MVAYLGRTSTYSRGYQIDEQSFDTFKEEVMTPSVIMDIDEYSEKELDERMIKSSTAVSVLHAIHTLLPYGVQIDGRDVVNIMFQEEEGTFSSIYCTSEGEAFYIAQDDSLEIESIRVRDTPPASVVQSIPSFDGAVVPLWNYYVIPNISLITGFDKAKFENLYIKYANYYVLQCDYLNIHDVEIAEATVYPKQIKEAIEKHIDFNNLMGAVVNNIEQYHDILDCSFVCDRVITRLDAAIRPYVVYYLNLYLRRENDLSTVTKYLLVNQYLKMLGRRFSE